MKSIAILPFLPPALAATSGTFNILSFNVAGLPEIINGNDVPGDKTENTEIIGERFSEYDYDIIHVQEDFNYHAALYSTDTHPYRTATSGGVPFGSGLNTLANFDWIDFERVKWETCSNASGADCLTPKGFTVMRVKVDEGVYVDCYNLHADAGSEDEDVTARSANLQQVADYIATNSIGNAVLVFGDTNARYTSSGENIRVFQSQEDMVNPWVELILDGVEPEEGIDAITCTNPTTTQTCETVDKIFYRGSPALTLQATSWAYEDEKFLNNGSILSDHNPISSEFSWTVSDSFRLSNLYGGPHGTWFNDLTNLSSSTSTSSKPTEITISGNERLDSLSITLTDGTTFTHGGDGGTPTSLTLTDGENWTSTRLCQGKHNAHTRIFYISITTDAGNVLSVGTETEECVTYEAESGFGVLGAWGRSGDEIDMLGFVYGVAA
ncbi:endonuclease/exonuclease/phosphatase family protein [Aspergillus undulatus]|uniref:endonuclease/exonuclease/phosphatase family protein n=1 Tax=Aspergillus undulatus TaxID=1810928 RepID=UPI003CCD1466